MVATARYIGFGKETTYGTAVAAAFHVDEASVSLDAPSGTEMYYGGGLSRGIRKRRAGFYSPKGNIVYGWDIRTIAFWLRMALGGYTFTAASPNRHEAYALNDTILPSLTARVGRDVFEHIFAGCVVESLELDLASDFLMLTAALNAQKDSKGSLVAEASLLLPAEVPMAFHEVTFELPSATDKSANVKGLKLTIKNGPRVQSGKSVGSRFPRRMASGDRVVNLTGELWFEDTTQLESFWGGATGPVAGGAADFAAKVTADAGSSQTLVLLANSCHFTKVAQAIKGRDEISQAFEMQMLEANHSLASATVVKTELLATVRNSQATLA